MGKPEVAIIGNGGIAKHLAKRIRAKGEWVFSWQAGRSEYAKRDYPEQEIIADLIRLQPRLVFLCISTKDKGEAAARYIEALLSANIAVVTCEKGALAYRAGSLRQFLHNSRFGYSAAVGGGTHILSYLAERRPNGRPMYIEVVVNGTLNYVFHQVQVSGGKITLGEACIQAQKLGYAEPGANDPVSLIQGEMSDVLMKLCVVFNTILAKQVFITPASFSAMSMNAQHIQELAHHSGAYRMMVCFSNQEKIDPGMFLHSGAGLTVSGWYMRVGFRHVDDDMRAWLPDGVGNAVCITEGALGEGGRYILQGPGAGAEPTTTAMLNDAHRILRQS